MEDPKSRSQELADKIDRLREQVEPTSQQEIPSKSLSPRRSDERYKSLGMLTLPQHIAGVGLLIAFALMVHFCVPS